MRTPRPWNYHEQIEHQAEVARWDREIEQYNDGYKPPSPPLIHEPQPIKLWKPWGEIVWDKNVNRWRVLILRTQERVGRCKRRMQTSGSYNDKAKAREVLAEDLRCEWANYHELKGWMR